MNHTHIIWRRYRGYTRTCEECGLEFEASRYDAAYCSNACRQKAYRKRKSTDKNVTDNDRS